MLLQPVLYLRVGEQGTCLGPPFLGTPLRVVLRLNVPYFL